MEQLNRDEYLTHVGVSAIIATLSLGPLLLLDILNLNLSLSALPYIILCSVSGFYIAKDEQNLRTHYKEQAFFELDIIDYDDDESVGGQTFLYSFFQITMFTFIGYFYIHERRKLTDKKGHLTSTYENVQRLLSKAKSAVDNGEYEEAIADSRRAWDEIETLEIDTEEIKSLRNKITNLQNRWIEVLLSEAETTADNLLSEAESAAEDSDYKRAIELATRVTHEATEAREKAEKLPRFDYSERTESTLKNLHDQAQEVIFEWSLEWIESQLNEAESVAEESNYRRAADMATTVAEIAPQLVDPVKDEDFDWDSYNSFCNQAKEYSTDWERQWLVTRINNVQSQDLGDYEQTKTEFEDILSALNGTEALNGRELELLKEEAYVAYAQTLKDHAEQSLATAKESAADGEHEAAIESFENVALGTDATLEKIQEWDIEEVDTINQIQEDLSHRYLDSRIASTESQIKIGIRQFKSEKYEAAGDTFTEATEFAEQAITETEDGEENDQLMHLLNIAEHNADATRQAVLGVGDATPQIRELEDSSTSETAVTPYESSAGESGYTTVGSQQTDTAGAIPIVNPAAPDIDVTYTAITKHERIGKGGDADVFRATIDADSESYQVALKQPRSSGTVHTDRLDRFVNEAETWSKIDDHDYIVGVVDWDTTPVPWILLEYMNAGNLSEYAGTLDLEQSIWIAQCVAEGVSHAHTRGIAHLDLKPENILFRTTGPETYPVPKVADWGLSKAILDNKGEENGLSPQYAAPEQVDSDRFGTPDQATDLYQLGAVFYDLFVGHPPFEGDIDEVLTGIVEKEVVPPSKANTDLPAAIDQAILTALEKEKKNRYESVLYLRDALVAVSDSPTS